MTKRQQAFDFFVRQGWTAAQAAGLVANLEAESALRPDAVGDGGQAYGIAQWHPPRQRDFTAVMGKDIRGSSFEEQLAFVHAELRGNEKAAGDALASCVTAAEAGACVSTMYERPADREGEATKRATRAEIIFAEYAPAESTTTAPAGSDVPMPPKLPKEARMGALSLLQLFAPILSTMLPQIAPLLGGGDKTNKYAGVAQVVLDTITKTAGAENLQGAMEKMQADPAVKAAVQAAVVTHPEVIGLMEIGGGIAAARESNLAAQNADKPFIYNPAFWVTLLLLPLVYWIVGSVLVGGTEGAWTIFGRSFNEETRSGTVNLVIGMVLGGIVGIWFGTSYGSMRKTELAAQTGK